MFATYYCLAKQLVAAFRTSSKPKPILYHLNLHCMKSFISLGKVLGKQEQKRIRGGYGGSVCLIGAECKYIESGTGEVTGRCEENSRGSCVCNAQTSSVVWSACNNP